jgi:hypothetical protein
MTDDPEVPPILLKMRQEYGDMRSEVQKIDIQGESILRTRVAALVIYHNSNSKEQLRW